MIQRYSVKFKPILIGDGRAYVSKEAYESPDGEYIKLSDVLALLDKERAVWVRTATIQSSPPNQVRSTAVVQAIASLRAELGEK